MYMPLFKFGRAVLCGAAGCVSGLRDVARLVLLCAVSEVEWEVGRVGSARLGIVPR
jgi:hypothetical protein